jgi:hypothetical protein
MENGAILSPANHKISFDMKLPKDPNSTTNKIIQKGYSFSICLLNISIKIGITIAVIVLIFNQIKNEVKFEEIKNIFQEKNFTK